MAKLPKVDLVFATWCPHCVPTVLAPLRELASSGKVALHEHDIDEPDQEETADRLVRSYGDWAEDYLIPQVFVSTDDADPRHLFTGWPEGVGYTERAWNRLTGSGGVFAPTGPAAKARRLRAPASDEAGRSFLEEHFSLRGSCLHCEEGSGVEVLSSKGPLVVAQVCPSRYVSRLIGFQDDADRQPFGRAVKRILDGNLDFAEEDVRIASRYGRELLEIPPDTTAFRQAYWNQNYRRTRVESSTRPALFLCERCGSPFFQPADSVQRLCPASEKHEVHAGNSSG